MDLDKLRLEVEKPEYSDMSNQETADAINTKTVVRMKSSLSGDDIFNCTVPSEFAALSQDKKVLWLSFCGRDSIDPQAEANVEFVKWIFGNASGTVTALGVARQETVLYAQSIGLAFVGEHHIASIREG